MVGLRPECRDTAHRAGWVPLGGWELVRWLQEQAWGHTAQEGKLAMASVQWGGRGGAQPEQRRRLQELGDSGTVRASQQEPRSPECGTFGDAPSSGQLCGVGWEGKGVNKAVLPGLRQAHPNLGVRWPWATPGRDKQARPCPTVSHCWRAAQQDFHLQLPVARSTAWGQWPWTCRLAGAAAFADVTDIGQLLGRWDTARGSPRLQVCGQTWGPAPSVGWEPFTEGLFSVPHRVLGTLSRGGGMGLAHQKGSVLVWARGGPQRLTCETTQGGQGRRDWVVALT